MTGKELRLSRFITHEQATIVDICGAEISKKNFLSIISRFNGVLVNLKQLKNFYSFTGFKETAGLLLRINSIEEKIPYISKSKQKKKTNQKTENIVSLREALKTGVCACVTSFFLGYGDYLESENIKIINEQMRTSAKIELPLLVEVKVDGPRIGSQNYSRTIKMAITMLTEWGADGILIPNPGEEVFTQLEPFDFHPLFIKEEHSPKSDTIKFKIKENVQLINNR